MEKITLSRWIIFSLLLLSLGAVWIWLSSVEAGTTTQGAVPAPQSGFLAPDFELETFDRETYRLSDLRGRPVLINFWASWCPPCRSEMPAIQNVYDEYRTQGFEVLAVNSTHQDNLGDAITFAQVRDLTFPILLDRDGAVGTLYDIRSLPTSFFIDQEGIIQDVVIGGPMAEALLKIRAEQLFAGNP
ncbi:MAG: TlpA family protein disulfide reductase [Chloroflexota bacterium]|nr:MAG: TlpA family protein disulfide reductase [Chloroflexota bacterium]